MATLIIVRLSTKRSLAEKTAFDAVLVVIITPAVLVQNGRLERKNMFWNHISKHDLEEDMRLDANTEDLSKIKTARLERSGDISFIKTE